MSSADDDSNRQTTGSARLGLFAKRQVPVKAKSTGLFKEHLAAKQQSPKKDKPPAKRKPSSAPASASSSKTAKTTTATGLNEEQVAARLSQLQQGNAFTTEIPGLKYV